MNPGDTAGTDMSELDKRIGLLKPVGLTYELALGLARFRVRFGYEKTRARRTVTVTMAGHLKGLRYSGLNTRQRPGLRMARIAVGWFLQDRGISL